MIASVVLHLGIVVGLATASSASPRRGPVETVITTKLVRLGTERPKDLLPRKATPPPPAKAVPVPVAREAEPAAKSVPAPTAQDRLNEMSRLSSAMQRLKQADGEEAEGHPDGSPEGEVTNLAQALVGNRYATEIYSCVKKHYSIEGIPPERVRERQARVFVRVNADGSFFDFRLERSSGLAAFDRAVEKAIRLCGRVSAPPGEIAAQVRADGIEFDFVP